MWDTGVDFGNGLSQFDGRSKVREESESPKILRLIDDHLKQINFPRLTRPQIRTDEPPPRELIDWAVRAYCFPWIRHFGVLMSGIVTLEDAGNRPAVRIVGRSSYELCAHIYYVKKHLKQHIDANRLDSAFKFLTPIQTGSRYVNEFHSGSEPFPTGVHIKNAINCFREAMPRESVEDYSYLSEFCHPNVMTFMQHYRWTTPETIDLVNANPFGAYGAIVGSSLMGLVAAHELLGIGHETDIRRVVGETLSIIAEEGQKEDGVQDDARSGQ
jgi:hypothetical protein